MVLGLAARSQIAESAVCLLIARRNADGHCLILGLVGGVGARHDILGGCVVVAGRLIHAARTALLGLVQQSGVVPLAGIVRHFSRLRIHAGV